MNIIQYNILILFYFTSYISQNYLIFYKILTKDKNNKNNYVGSY